MVGLLLLSGCGGQERVTKTKIVDHPVEVLAPGYAGAAACKECHDYQHETWHDSYHRTMTTVAGPQTVKGNFTNQMAEAFGVYCIMERVGDDFWIEKNQEGRSSRHKVEVITGSHHMQTYWYSLGNMRAMGMAPVIYLLDEQRWIPRYSAFLNPPITGEIPSEAEAFRWSYTCIKCHVTHGTPGLTWKDKKIEAAHPVSMETRASEFGISCEACHGPADEHVKLRRANPGKTIVDDPIVLPSELDSARSSQVCAQCHSIRMPISESEHLRFYEHGPTFCAGMTLEESGQYLLTMDGDVEHPPINQEFVGDADRMRGYFWGDGMVRVSGREYNGLVNSPCYTHDDPKRRMSCLDCHQMHQDKNDARPRIDWADDQLKAGQREAASCIKCHEGYDTIVHTHHAAGSVGSNCLNCHMPYTTYGLLKAIRSHTISSPNIMETKQYGRPNACNLCHLDKSLGWASNYLAEWYRHERVPLHDIEEGVPASMMWAYKGDAGLRALTAWSLGWSDARAVSGTNWMPTILIDLMRDDYDAVRFMAHRSMRKDPRMAEIPYDFVAPIEQRQTSIEALRRRHPVPDAWKGLVDWTLPGISENLIYEMSLKRDVRPVSLLE